MARVIARSASDEAIQGPFAHALDCFAALAMTSGNDGAVILRGVGMGGVCFTSPARGERSSER